MVPFNLKKFSLVQFSKKEVVSETTEENDVCLENMDNNNLKKGRKIIIENFRLLYPNQ